MIWLTQSREEKSGYMAIIWFIGPCIPFTNWVTMKVMPDFTSTCSNCCSWVMTVEAEKNYDCEKSLWDILCIAQFTPISPMQWWCHSCIVEYFMGDLPILMAKMIWDTENSLSRSSQHCKNANRSPIWIAVGRKRILSYSGSCTMKTALSSFQKDNCLSPPPN